MSDSSTQDNFEKIVRFIRDIYLEPYDTISLHAPVFCGNENKYLEHCIKSTFVSSVGEYVDRFEKMVSDYTGARYAVATVNGTAALHMALHLAGVSRDDEVITQGLTFIATANAIAYCGAHPIFLDIDKDNLGLSPSALRNFLENECDMRNDGLTYFKKSGKPVKACVPVHVLGHPVRIEEIQSVCKEYNICLIEDTAEGLGSFFHGRHAGTFGMMGVLSFNGNKIITTGGGGMILTDDAALAARARHLTTTAKIPHPWKYEHDEIGYNYRLPNINAALGCAQMEMLPSFLENKRRLSELYKTFFESIGIEFFQEPPGCRSNYWLNAIILDSNEELESFLNYTHAKKVMTRPLWSLLSGQTMYRNCFSDRMENARRLADLMVNIPSSVRHET